MFRETIKITLNQLKVVRRIIKDVKVAQSRFIENSCLQPIDHENVLFLIIICSRKFGQFFYVTSAVNNQADNFLKIFYYGGCTPFWKQYFKKCVAQKHHFFQEGAFHIGLKTSRIWHPVGTLGYYYFQTLFVCNMSHINFQII